MWRGARDEEREEGAARAEENPGVEHGFELLLHQPRLCGAGLLVVAEEAREPLGAVAVTIPRGLELVGLEHSERWGLGRRGWVGVVLLGVAFGYLVLKARSKTRFVEAPHGVGIAEGRKAHSAATVPIGSAGEGATNCGGQHGATDCGGQRVFLEER